MSRADRELHRELIGQTVQKTKVKGSVLREESFRRLHRCLTAKRKEKSSEIEFVFFFLNII